jgi:5-hydroxyisourate hydrolase
MISTHVLDTESGAPARGVRVELYRNGDLLAADETNEDGRIPELSPAPLETGEYRIVFHPPSAFFRRIELSVSVDDTARHYHVPLLFSSYSCASYRGS